MPGEGRAPLRDAIFALGPHVRYVAFGSGQDVDARQREGLRDASSGESDFYEELLVNPTLLTLVRQRGELDCGGLKYVIVAYGSFSQIVVPVDGGHVSVCIAADADAVDAAVRVAELVATSSARPES